MIPTGPVGCVTVGGGASPKRFGVSVSGVGLQMAVNSGLPFWFACRLWDRSDRAYTYVSPCGVAPVSVWDNELFHVQYNGSSIWGGCLHVHLLGCFEPISSSVGSTGGSSSSSVVRLLSSTNIGTSASGSLSLLGLE